MAWFENQTFLLFHISFFSTNKREKSKMTAKPPSITPPEGYDYIAEGQAVIIFPKDHSVFYNNVFLVIYQIDRFKFLIVIYLL